MAVAARRILPTALAAVLLAAALSGCSLQQLADLVPHTEMRGDDGSITAGGTTDVFTLREGDCLDDATLAAPSDDAPADARPAGDEDTDPVGDVSTVPCSEPHDFEVYANVTIAGDAFPGDDAVGSRADDLCGSAFGTFIDFDYQDSIYDYRSYQPTSGSWSTGDRTANCLIGDPAGKTVGSLAGIGR
ncbi:hypothetical protein DZG00_12675 [Clavibacter lycopersici]|uniref:Septum formation-related domain-containing protein n=2 Tax=Clavibacter lycopersici TaxID=2301718 RepID=A0A399SWM0_9MICO|nr:septum formation family protein [Clavibacter lycopersici]RIJ48456.1 hypothetical protein DZG00_12675 [Clavibacter lycopersici]RIJ60182.1 hypothetical protein DZG02_10470 [Clavibacter lycopersici]